jgi:oxygen-independent coproporphyrinogen-3 oxidase
LEINSLELGHASLYELSIESGSKFSHQNLHLPDNDEMARMYAAVGETLALPRYEVSNYGDPCLHNVNVWDGEQYLGLGPGAAGRVLIDGQWRETGVKASPLKLGELRLPDIKTLSARQRAMEMLITGLRAVRGIRMRPEIMEIIDLEFANQRKLFKISAENGEKRLSVKNFLLLDSLMVSLMQ